MAKKMSAMTLVFGNAKEEVSEGRPEICSPIYHFDGKDCKNISICKVFKGKNFDQKMQVFFKYQDKNLAKKGKSLIASVNIDVTCLDWAEEGDYLDPSKVVIFQRMANTGRPFTRIAFKEDAIVEKGESEKTLDWDEDNDVPF